MWFSGKMLSEGIQKHVIQGVTVPVYSVAKTVADCFRFRHHIGVNIRRGGASRCVAEQESHV